MKKQRPAGLLILSLLGWLLTPMRAENAVSRSSPAQLLPPASWMLIENVGQFDPQVRFQGRSGNATFWLTDNALWITLQAHGPTTPSALTSTAPGTASSAVLRGVNIKISFLGATATPELAPGGRVEAHISYFHGHNPSQWRVAVPVWRTVRYHDLYPGVDLQLGSAEDGGEVGFAMGVMANAPSALEGATGPALEPALDQVHLRIEGAEVMAIEDGGIRLDTAVGEYRLPLQSRSATGAVRPLSPTQVVGDNGLVSRSSSSTRPGAQDEATAGRQPLDGHEDLIFSTFLGGANSEELLDMALDAQGTVYLTGMTQSIDFPAQPGVFDPTYNGGFTDAFVAKLSADGRHLLYATYLGGNDYDSGLGITADAQGSAYVTGYTLSPDFPVTAGTVMTTLLGYSDAFVVKLNAAGSELLYSSLLGGSGRECPPSQSLPERVCSIAVDASGKVYIGGTTDSSDFPTTANAFDTSFNGGFDAFVTVLDAAASAVISSTYIGGNTEERVMTIARDSAGSVYLQGVTASDNFPVTPGAFGTYFNGGGWPWGDVFVAKFNSALSGLAYATYLGGTDYECLGTNCQMSVDEFGAVYVAGITNSSNFPVTPGAFQPACHLGSGAHPCRDAFVSKLNPAGSALEYSTFLGGQEEDRGEGIAVDSQGRAYVAGATWSPDFPTTPDAYNPSFAGVNQAYLTQFAPDGSTADYSTFIGGTEWTNFAVEVALDRSGGVYLAGHTWSSDFPTTPGAYDRTFNGALDLFVAKLVLGMQPQSFLPMLQQQ